MLPFHCRHARDLCVVVMASLHISLSSPTDGRQSGCKSFAITIPNSALFPDRQLQARNSNPFVTLWPITAVL